MKKFLKTSLSFLVPCFATFAAITAWALLTEFMVYRSRIRISDETRYVVIGDSQSEMAVDPSIFTNLVNQSTAALSIEQALYKIKDLLAVNGDRSFTIILEVSPRRLLRGLRPLTTSDFESRYALLNFLHIFKSHRRIGEPIRLLRDRIVKDAFSHLTGRKFSKKRNKRTKNAWGGFAPRDEKRYVTHPNETAKETDSYIESILKNRDYSDAALRHNLAILEEAINAVKVANKRIMLLTAPWHRTLLGRYPPGMLKCFCDSLSELADRHDVSWVNTLDWQCPDDGWTDQHHLNTTGAKRYTAFLRSLLANER